MNEIKKSIEQIPLPDHLHEVAYKRLHKSVPKRAKRWMFPTVAALLLLLFTTPIVFSNYISISDFFDSKDQKTSAIDESILVVESEMFTISLKELVDYKENLLLTHELNNIPFKLSNMELLNRLIENELVLYEAINYGVIVTEQEVTEYAEQTKQAMAEANDPILNEINEELEKRLGVTVEEYFTHPNTFAQNELLLTSNKFFSQLYSEGVLTDQYTPEQYKAHLHEKYGDKIKVNKEELRAIEGK